MSTFRDKLTEEDMKDISPRETLINYLEVCRRRFGLEKSEIKVLDWGCGRGMTVLLLRERGYEAFGADINREALENGKDLSRKRIGPEQSLRLIGTDGRTSFPDGFFHFIFSEQVFEHVEDLNMVASELSRLSKIGGMGQHSFPAHKRIVESHLHMPFVHWFPKNSIRKYYIFLLVLLGFGPKFKTVEGKNICQKTEIYYRGNITTSFYRTYRVVQRCLEKYGFDVEFISIKNPKLSKILLFTRITRVPLLRSFVNWVLLNFVGIALVTKKRRLRIE